MPPLVMPISALDQASTAASQSLLALLSDRRFAALYAQERAWLEQVRGLDCKTAHLLAVRGAASHLMTRGIAAASFEPALAAINDLATSPLAATGEQDLCQALLQAAGVDGAMSDAALTQIRALWPLAACTEQLLASGGDERLTLHAFTRMNKYGCHPWPDETTINFGSCTASSPSPAAFAAAEHARRLLLGEAVATSPARALADAADAISEALLRYYGVQDLAEAVLAASGTDAALVVTSLLAAEHPHCHLTSILVSPSETGSGVPNAVQGRHFAACAPSGRSVGKGEPIDGLAQHSLSLATIPLRNRAGEPRQPDEILSQIESAIHTGLGDGRVVIHAMDGSKTGLTAPGRDACRRLAEMYGPALDIVIDACQARLEPTLVRGYLEQGFPVLITGSKFFTAPGFCGAVLFPRGRLNRITRAGRLPAGLAAYARLQDGFGSRRCAGLVLRWSAALSEMGAFGGLSPDFIRAQLARFGGALRDRVARDARLKLIAAPRPEGAGWSDCPSVFTIGISGPEGWMGTTALRRVYEAMAGRGSGDIPAPAVKTQIGQPVELGQPELGGLRIAVSAAQVSSPHACAGELELVMGNLRDTLAKLDHLSRPAADLASAAT